MKKMLESGAMVEQFCINEHITVEQFKSDLQILERNSLISMRSMAQQARGAPIGAKLREVCCSHTVPQARLVLLTPSSLKLKLR